MISNDEAIGILNDMKKVSDPHVHSVNNEIETGRPIIADRAFGRFWQGKVDGYEEIQAAYKQLYEIISVQENPVETVKQAKAFLDSTLVTLNVEIRKCEPLVKDPTDARYSEGKMIGLRNFQEWFEKLLDPLNLIELP